MYDQYKELLLVLKLCLTKYNCFNSVNESDKTGLPERIIPPYSQKQSHQF